ncbi:MAG: hypothetical protein JWM98_2490 [Thermoleophilia bacterium]|nr:hypothetical protein [Thermoleophilia bacterium]
MPESRVPASAGQFHGELRLTSEELVFVPVTLRSNDQMVLGVGGWSLAWHEVAGLERLGARRGLEGRDTGGDVRIHHAPSGRSVVVAIHGSLRDFFRSADSFLATTVEPADVTAA